MVFRICKEKLTSIWCKIVSHRKGNCQSYRTINIVSVKRQYEGKVMMLKGKSKFIQGDKSSNWQ